MTKVKRQAGPKYGDARAKGPCPLCHGMIFEEFTTENVYHDDVQDVWRTMHHNCIVALRERLDDLEHQIRRLRSEDEW